MRKSIEMDRKPHSSKQRVTRLMIVVEDTKVSKRAIDYVGRLVGRRKGFHVCLVHPLISVPPELLEFGGAENPADESRLDQDLKSSQQRWITTAQRKARGLLDQASTILRDAGLRAGILERRLLSPLDKRDTIDEILKLARTCGCTTIVIGRQSLSWLQALVREDVAGKLVRQATGLTVWVVE